MGFRFQKRIRIFKGLTLNVSKTGTSWTVGRPGASVNVRKNKISGTVGIPGSGLSYRETLVGGKQEAPGENRGGSGGKALFWFLVVLLIAYLFGR